MNFLIGILRKGSLLFGKHNPQVTLSLLLLFVTCCDFNTPALRAFLYLSVNTLEEKYRMQSSPEIKLLLAGGLCAPYSLLSGQTHSLALSMVFSAIISSLPSKPGPSLICFYALSIPIFFCTLGFPHYSSLALSPLFSIFIGSLFTPLTLASILSDHIEHIALRLWWQTENILLELFSFFGNPKPPQAGFSQKSLILTFFYIFSFKTLTFGIRPLWKRQSYSFLP